MGEADRSLLDSLESTVKKHSDIVGMASGYPQYGIRIQKAEGMKRVNPMKAPAAAFCL